MLYQNQIINQDDPAMGPNVQLIHPQFITIGGVRVPIVPFQELYQIEYEASEGRNYNFNVDNYTDFLFHNLGYINKPTPEILNTWMNDLSGSTSIENLPKNKRITALLAVASKIKIQPDGMSLNDLLDCIYFWGRGVFRQGLILDEETSFISPSLEEIRYKMENNIEIELLYYTSNQFWSKSNIWAERAHNICPEIDYEYFNHCIHKFSTYANQIQVKTPISVFVSAIINPSILFTIIRDCEIQAAKNIAKNKNQYRYTSLLKDEDKIRAFIPLFDERIKILDDMFKQHGAKAFVDYVKEEIVSFNMSKLLHPQADLNIQQERKALDEWNSKSLEERKKFIDQVECNEANLTYIFSHILKESIPKKVLEMYTVIDDRGNKVNRLSYLYYSFMRRIFNILKQLDSYYPELVRGKNTLMISKPFFVDDTLFGLYHPDEKLIVIADRTYHFTIMTLQDAIQFYWDKYGIRVLLDPIEIGDALEYGKTNNVVFDQQIPKDKQNNYVQPAYLVPHTVLQGTIVKP